MNLYFKSLHQTTSLILILVLSLSLSTYAQLGIAAGYSYFPHKRAHGHYLSFNKLFTISNKEITLSCYKNSLAAPEVRYISTINGHEVFEEWFANITGIELTGVVKTGGKPLSCDVSFGVCAEQWASLEHIEDIEAYRYFNETPDNYEGTIPDYCISRHILPGVIISAKPLIQVNSAGLSFPLSIRYIRLRGTLFSLGVMVTYHISTTQ